MEAFANWSAVTEGSLGNRNTRNYDCIFTNDFLSQLYNRQCYQLTVSKLYTTIAISLISFLV